MNKAKKHVYYDYVADMEAKYGDGRSNRTLVAELSGKERASERLFYKASPVLSPPYMTGGIGRNTLRLTNMNIKRSVVNQN